MSHYVICTKCGKKFDRDKEQAVKDGGRRYAHYKCFPTGELVPLPQKDPDLTALEDYIEKLLGEDYNHARVKKQLKDFQQEYQYTYSGILKTLKYWYEIKNNPIAKANGGIGIVPYIYEDARQYYYNLYLAKLANEEKDINSYKPKIKEIEIFPPKVQQKRIKLLFDSEE